MARGVKDAVVRPPQFAGVDWPQRGKKILNSLEAARKTIGKSRDPLRESRYFLATVPEKTVRKLSRNIRLAPDGFRDEETDYAGQHARVFRRLGLDLLSVDSSGRALVHAAAAKFERLVKTAGALAEEDLREQARWITIHSFDAVPSSWRVDDDWLKSLSDRDLADSVVELQPLLSRSEVDLVMRAIRETVGAKGEADRFTRAGTDYSGRRWFRGKISRSSVRLIAENFYSVQAIHHPLTTPVMAAARRRAAVPQVSSAPLAVDPASLPVVGVFDVGVPEHHPYLESFRRGIYIDPEVVPGQGADHGSLVASRVVYGDFQYSAGQIPAGTCRFLDVNVSHDPTHVDDKALFEALTAVARAYPDVRVFNLSFGSFQPLASCAPVLRREKLLQVEELDNFAFQNDVVIVVAAGNAVPGTVPSPAYPSHVDVPDWALGSWASGFNTLKCGSYVGSAQPSGLAKTVGWPSPFTRIGPGIADAPVPDFSASGGDAATNYKYAPGLGVWCCNASGLWEDQCGTSFAAPLLAREAAFVMAELQKRCEQGARPFAATTKAFLALTATRPATVPRHLETLADRTLGRGRASAGRLQAPPPESAVFLWQGVLAGPEDVARIQLPVPKEWRIAATMPLVRVVAAWESPVNSAMAHVWASRRVEVQLRATPAGKAVNPKGKNHFSYPLLDRSYDLSAQHLASLEVTPAAGDYWDLEVTYKEVGEYVATMEFSPHQRVGLAIELLDGDPSANSPQEAIQKLPSALTMVRLAIPENRIANPIVVRVKT